MEPPIIALAREMFIAYLRCDEGPRLVEQPGDEWHDLLCVEDKRGWLAAALVARPDLADARVPKGHWASGLLKEEP